MVAAASGAGVTPAVSVALCTCNGERFLREQLRSICLQTYQPSEIVLSDDASADSTLASARQIVDECMAARPGPPVVLRVLRNAVALGVARNFQQAIGACCGELVALCDQDDVWRLDKLALMVERFVNDPELTLLHTDARLVNASQAPLGHTLFEVLGVSKAELKQIHRGHAFDVLLRRNLVTGATAMFRRQLADKAFPVPAHWVHDEWLGVMAAACGRVDVLELPLIDYRQHDANQIGARRASLREVAEKLLTSRSAAHAVRLHRAQVLVERLRLLGDAVAPDIVIKAQDKLEHQQRRSKLPASRLARCWPMAREAATGRYALYNRGWRAMFRDLWEAA
jgi:hypothetical protein